jgi:2-polyprenyl-3-methyl-5-hydroxy-6-metoxy-1,4-benzoquinol methylase
MNQSFSHNLAVGHLTKCQICGSPDLELILDLGHQAPCDSLLTRAQLDDVERTFPLKFVRCTACGLAQIDYVVAPEELFHLEYPYRSGITATLLNNLQSIASKHIDTLNIPRGGLAVDIGSNDGTILQGFKREGMRVLGVEPTNIAKLAVANGIPTVQSFFTREVVRKIIETDGHASMVTAANMFAHVAQLAEIISGAEELLTENGIFLTESHYLPSLLATVQYDSIYHEHLKYYSLQALQRLMGQYNFTIIDAEKIPNYGGSIRVVARKGKGHPEAPRLKELLAAEKEMKLDTAEPFIKFRERVLRARTDLQTLLLKLQAEGQTIAGVGCPGRSSTLVNFSNIDPTIMPYIAEQSTSLKLGLYLPGKHIPIVDEKILFDDPPDNVVMLSWHYCEPIIRALRKKGLKSRIIIPLPEVHFYPD